LEDGIGSGGNNSPAPAPPPPPQSNTAAPVAAAAAPPPVKRSKALNFLKKKETKVVCPSSTLSVCLFRKDGTEVEEINTERERYKLQDCRRRDHFGG